MNDYYERFEMALVAEMRGSSAPPDFQVTSAGVDVQVLQVTAGLSGSPRRDSGEPANFRAVPR